MYVGMNKNPILAVLTWLCYSFAGVDFDGYVNVLTWPPGADMLLLPD
jgi:hypothetical protein